MNLTGQGTEARMLIITRKPGEGLILKTPFGSIGIRFLPRNRVAIEAPPSVSVLREEFDDGKSQ